ncbi:MAG: class I SAM-dependent DNA methyltransferase [Phycisphaerales bacterium JB059]
MEAPDPTRHTPAALREALREGLRSCERAGRPPADLLDDLAHRFGPDADLGAAYEQVLSETAAANAPTTSRRVSGSFYTPARLVEHLLDVCLEPVIEDAISRASDPADRESALLALRVLDPACGSGRFLLAAGRRLASRLAQIQAERQPPSATQRADALAAVGASCLAGVDIDPVALTIAGHELRRVAPTFPAEHLRVDNALALAFRDDTAEGGAPAAWADRFPQASDRGTGREAGFDVVIGNPPFLNQLETATAAQPELADRLRLRFPGLISAYTDLSIAFLLTAWRLTRPEGRFGFVMPLSFLSSRDAAPAREHLLTHARLETVWAARESVFPGASVRTCAVSFARTPSHRSMPVRRFTSPAIVEVKPLAPEALEGATHSWSRMAAFVEDVPEVRVESARRLADICEATADFRDQYYGLQGAILETPTDEDGPSTPAPSSARLVTSGLIDLACCHWGTRPTRIHKRRWIAPRVNRDAFEPGSRMESWLNARLVPKVLLATQTRILEVYVDSQGVCVPSVPIITITPHPGECLWRIAAALASPVCSALAMRRYAGAALHADAIKLSAKQTLELPVPTDSGAWSCAADHFRQASGASDPGERDRALAAYAPLAIRAFGVRGAALERLLAWWSPRVSGARRSPRAHAPT